LVREKRKGEKEIRRAEMVGREMEDEGDWDKLSRT